MESNLKISAMYSITCVNDHTQKDSNQDQLSLNAGHKYCRMFQGEHSAILLTSIKRQFVIKIFVLSIFEWTFYTCFAVLFCLKEQSFVKREGSLKFFQTFLCNSQNYHPKVPWMIRRHCCTRPKAEGSSALGHSQHRGLGKF